MIRSCLGCDGGFEPAEVEPPRLTCSPGCLAVVDASLGVLLGDGPPGPREQATVRRLVACRYPPSRPHYWMARGALVLARFVDRHGADQRLGMLPVCAERALSHALDPPGSPDSALDRIRAGGVLRDVELWARNFAPGNDGA